MNCLRLEGATFSLASATTIPIAISLSNGTMYTVVSRHLRARNRVGPTCHESCAPFTKLELRDKRMLEAFFKGQASIAEDLVFPSKAGTVLNQNHLTQYQFLPCLDRAGLRRFRFHDLRHTFGSLLIRDGASRACEGSNGPQFHPGDGGYVRASYSGSGHRGGRSAGCQHNSATKCNSRATCSSKRNGNSAGSS